MAPESEDRPIRECPICPPQVERCVHYDGKWIILHKQGDIPGFHWLVCVGRDSLPPTFREGLHSHLTNDGHGIYYDGPNYQFASDTFEERAALLIGA